MKITSFSIAILISLLIFATPDVSAQSVPKGKWRFGLGIDGILPVGELTNTANFGLGLTPRFQYGVSDRFALTFTTGLYHFFTKTLYVGGGDTMENKLDISPVKAGIKAFVTPKIYLGGEIGLGLRVDNSGGNGKIIASPGFGYATQKWDIGVRYENLSEPNIKNTGFVGLRLAYGFGL